MGPKIDVMEREWKIFNFWGASKQGLDLIISFIYKFINTYSIK
jgi:hypothetical protein